MANEQPPPEGSWRARHTLGLSIAVTAAYLFIVVYVLRNLDSSNSVERTRLLLVLTLIISMLGFGGLLISRALFAKPADTTLGDRFRLAREIFLVFSGIFGTIIGFYFGTQDVAATSEPMQVEAKWANGQVTVTIAGGAGPFTGVLTSGDSDAGKVQKTETRALTYQEATCPPDAKLTVVDGAGHLAEATVDCGGGASGEEANQAANNAAENAAANEITAENAATNQ